MSVRLMFAAAVLAGCRAEGIHTAVETSAGKRLPPRGTATITHITTAASRTASPSCARTSPRTSASPTSVCSWTSTLVRTIRAPCRLASTTRSLALGAPPGAVTGRSSSAAARAPADP